MPFLVGITMRLNERDSLQLIYQTSFGGEKVFIDKENETILLEYRYLFFLRRRRIIPFSAVKRVVFNSHEKRSIVFSLASEGPPVYLQLWEVYLDTDSERISIDISSRKRDMRSLAQRISRATGKETEVYDVSKGHTTDPKMTREEIMERWKKRTENERSRRSRG